jgi:hypothetical protein
MRLYLFGLAAAAALTFSAGFASGRRACLHKDELGEQGRGNCSWYRENCG